MRATIDLREQITQIEPQPVITRDNVTMEVDAVIYYVVADPIRATYEVQNLKWGIEQLTLSGLRNVIGALDLDHTLTSRDTINTQLRPALVFMPFEAAGVMGSIGSMKELFDATSTPAGGRPTPPPPPPR